MLQKHSELACVLWMSEVEVNFLYFSGNKVSTHEPTSSGNLDLGDCRVPVRHCTKIIQK